MRVTLALALAALAAQAACGTGEVVSRTVGARCDLSSECDELCLTGGHFPGGFCSISCDTTAQCPNGTTCVSDQVGVCLFSCAADIDCTFLGPGWTCKQVALQAGGGPVMACRGG
jgi:hypothetical protein